MFFEHYLAKAIHCTSQIIGSFYAELVGEIAAETRCESLQWVEQNVFAFDTHHSGTLRFETTPKSSRLSIPAMAAAAKTLLLDDFAVQIYG